MVNSFKVEFGWSLKALMELFSRYISGGKEGVKEPSCPTLGLVLVMDSGLADCMGEKLSSEETRILIFMLCVLDWYGSIDKQFSMCCLPRSQECGEVLKGPWLIFPQLWAQRNISLLAGTVDLGDRHVAAFTLPGAGLNWFNAFAVQVWSEAALCCFLLLVPYMVWNK